jgi:hypothetical protein
MQLLLLLLQHPMELFITHLFLPSALIAAHHHHLLSVTEHCWKLQSPVFLPAGTSMLTMLLLAVIKSLPPSLRQPMPLQLISLLTMVLPFTSFLLLLAVSPLPASLLPYIMLQPKLLLWLLMLLLFKSVLP